MNPLKSPYPDIVGSGIYFHVHACHRRTAIDTAITAMRKVADQERTTADAFTVELIGTTSEWVIKSLIQGAWIREYHEWEKATKDYFNARHARNSVAKVNWKPNNRSHVEKVREQLTIFFVDVPPKIMDLIDETRLHINDAKHSADFYVSEDNYKKFVGAVLMFWETISQQEMSPPKQQRRT